MSRRLFPVALGAVLLGVLIAAPSALADAFTPESGGSPNADDIDTLYKITLYIGIVIFLLVWGVLIWSLVKYRARRDGHADQIRGNTPLEVGWTIGAASILVVLTVVTFLYLDDIENPPASGPNWAERVGGAVRVGRPAGAAQKRRPGAPHPRERPAVHLALRLPRQQGAAVFVSEDGGAHGHHRRAEDRGV